MIPRSEHPNPQRMRAAWENLNGEWEFELDSGVSGISRRLFEKEHLDGKITVPFCPESKLSGIGNTDFLNCVWYRRDLVIPDAWRGGRVLLHFGAVDHIAHVYLNGVEVGTHTGGYVSFSFDITPFLQDGVNSLAVCAIDEDRNPMYGHGKQSRRYESYGCYYTRVTGIWQTVWMEYVPNAYVASFRLTPDIHNSTLQISADLIGGGELRAEAFYEGRPVGATAIKAPRGGKVSGQLALDELHLWELGEGRLYDLKLTYGEDEVTSYFGMRETRMDGYRFLLNGKSVFQRLVLDQGFYPDGVYTAPSDEALQNDIQISMDAGFNGARLHQKVFEPRFLYHCDRMGYMVWGEYGNWGIDYALPDAIAPLLYEWQEILERDYNHPSIIGWCPLNETSMSGGKRQNDELLRLVYRQTKALDLSRPCIDTSGWYHVETDIFDLHDYIQDPEKFAEVYNYDNPADAIKHFHATHKTFGKLAYTYRGEPVFVSEYGGIKWDVNSGLSNAWGYGNAPQTVEEFHERYKGLTDVLLDTPYLFGFCYTQLYDVEQETNGLYTYDRVPKFDMERIKAVNIRRAKIEE
ncbi:MAG: beta-galactosidase [Ruminococcaceae bacterium]|nr:beta-galactosidase [Oscillospiraceae bacterium]